MIIISEKIIIRSLRQKDLAGLARLTDNPNIYRYEPTYLPERSAAPAAVIGTLEKMDLWQDRQCVLGIFAHERSADDHSEQGHRDREETLLGLAEFYDYKPSGRVISVGYRLAEEYWGKGIGSACVGAMVDFLIKNTKVEMVTAHVIPDNKASAAILRKNGFELILTKEEDWGFEQPTTADVYVLDL